MRTCSELKEKICATLAGRAAEEIIFGKATSGALDDLEKVTRDAYGMVAYYGFNETLGKVSFYDSTRQETAFQKPYSEETARIIDEEVRKLIHELFDQAKTILIKNKPSLIALAERLLQKEVIYKDEIEEILGKRDATESVQVVTTLEHSLDEA